jgi:hypothetical protein
MMEAGDFNQPRHPSTLCHRPLARLTGCGGGVDEPCDRSDESVEGVEGYNLFADILWLV